MSEDVGEKLDKLLRKGNSENEKAEKFEKHGQKQRCILVFESADVIGNYCGEGAGGGEALPPARGKFSKTRSKHSLL